MCWTVASSLGSQCRQHAGRVQQGEGLVAALREVPGLFFQEDFALDRCPPLPYDPLPDEPDLVLGQSGP